MTVQIAASLRDRPDAMRRSGLPDGREMSYHAGRPKLRGKDHRQLNSATAFSKSPGGPACIKLPETIILTTSSYSYHSGTVLCVNMVDLLSDCQSQHNGVRCTNIPLCISSAHRIFGSA
jgi:hypothetical protein